MTKSNTPKELDAIVDTVLTYRPKARSKPAIQRKRRATIIAKEKAKMTKRCDKCGAVQRGEYNQWSTCRNVAACERRAAKAKEK